MVALKAEAQAFVDRYRLKNYKNENMEVCISGIGKENMYKATTLVLERFKNGDKIANIGICGASNHYSIGDMIDGFKHHIKCVDYQQIGGDFEIVDMESDGFFEATKDIKERYMFKIVSDHFTPNSVTKDMAKGLIFEKIDEIMQRLEQ